MYRIQFYVNIIIKIISIYFTDKFEIYPIRVILTPLHLYDRVDRKIGIFELTVLLYV